MAIRAPDSGPIRVLIDRTRRRALTVGVGTAVLLALAAAILGLLAAAVLLGLSDGRLPEWVGALVAAAGLGGAAWGVWRQALAPLRALSGDVALARHLERHLPRTEGLASAVEFLRETGAAPAWSPALAEAHVARVARSAATVDPAPAIPDRALRRAGALAAGALALHLLVLGLAGDTVWEGYRRLTGVGAFPAHLTGDGRPLPQLITGDIELVYRYPGYTGLEPRTVEGTSGEIRAPKGTEVVVRTTADRPVDAAALVVGDVALPMAVTERRRLEGRLVVNAGGSYRFRFLDDDGEPEAEGAPHAIVVEPDAPPEVTATLPGPDEDVREVRETDRLELRWRARDDYGLGEVALVWRIHGGTPQRRVLEHPEGGVRAEGAFSWDLSLLNLAPGDRVAWYVEALDNDAIEGPKAGASPTRTLKVFSAAEHHREVMARVEAVWEQMLDRLADHLEAPFDVEDGQPAADVEPLLADQEGLVEGLQSLGAALDDAVTKLAADPLAPPEMGPALSNVRAGLARVESRARQATRSFRSRLALRNTADRVYGRLVTRAWTESVEELEKDVLYLEDLLDQQKVQDLVAMGEEIKQHERRLAELIDRLRENPDEATRAAVSEEIARLKERIHELMRGMQSLAKEIQDEHLNAAALQDLVESRDLLGGLDEVQRLLNEGDLEQALTELARMTDNLDSMLASLKEEGQSFGGEEYAALSRELMEFVDGLERLQREQRQLHENAEKLSERYRKEVERRMQGAMEDLLERLSARAERARTHLQDVPEEALGEGLARFDRDTRDAAAERLENLQQLLRAGDLSEAHDVAREAARESARLAASLQGRAREDQEMARLLGRERDPAGTGEGARQAVQARQEAEGIVEALEHLFPDPQEVFGPEARRRMNRMARQQDELRRQGAALEQRMREIGQQAPVFSPGMEGELREAGRHMAEASHHLGGSDARRGAGQQRAALDRLAALQQQMQEAAQGAGGAGGVPMPMSTEGRGTGQGGFSSEPVEIPEEGVASGEAFRERLMEAMKEAAPERYEPQVKQYYEELVK